MNMDWILQCFPDYNVLVEFDNIEAKEEKQEIHGLKERINTPCMFCGKPFEFWGKKDTAHAVSECLGNKKLINFCECYDCNHLFGEIAENHLGKFIMPYRFISETYGKGKSRNVIKDKSENDNLSYGTYRFEQKKNVPVFQSETFDVHNMLIEKAGAGRLTMTKNGFRISIPRQKYKPQMVYVSLLKIAYTLLPIAELPHYINGMRHLYYYISMSSLHNQDGNQTGKTASEDDRQKYIDSLPNIGIEILLSSPLIKNGVNVCLLKRIKKADIEPKILFAIQMKWYTIVIPILSDDYASGNICKYSFFESENINARRLNFSEIEEEFICDMRAEKNEIPKELYKELEEDLKNSNLIRKKDL